MYYGTAMKIIAENKKAYHDYFVVEKFETGICLVGCEVKSLRMGEVNLKDSYASVDKGELWLHNSYIKEYSKGSFSNVNSRRSRKLLMHKNEIMRILGKVNEKGYSLVPLKIYFVDSLIKVELALVKGKQLFDKREAKKEKDLSRAQERDIADYI